MVLPTGVAPDVLPDKDKVYFNDYATLIQQQGMLQDTVRTSLYQFPQFTLLAIGIGAVALGIARAAINELVRLAQSKRRINSTATLADRAHSHLEVARAEAALRERLEREVIIEMLEVHWTALEELSSSRSKSVSACQ